MFLFSGISNLKGYIFFTQQLSFSSLCMKSDRFIPTSNYKNKHLGFLKQNKQRLQNDPKITKLYRMLVMEEESSKENNENFGQYRSLKFINDDQNQQGYEYLIKLGIDVNKISLGPTVINKPDRILEALSLSDNFYLNLLDCSQEAVLAVGLSRGIYLWRPSGSISRIREAPDIACIKWNQNSPEYIACGTKAGGVEVWDVQNNVCVSDFCYHQGRVGSVTWFQDPHCLLSGGKDSQILSYDIRTHRKTAKYKFHDQQICSLIAEPGSQVSNSQNFASGSNDKNLVIWSTRMKTPQLIYKHSAAVKGVAWHPTKSGVLASGGGTEDRSIKIWNTSSNQLVKSVDTGSQVCNLMYIKDGQSLVSTHGFNKFETNIWDSPSMTKKQTLIGHSKRVLYLAAEPDGQTIITGAGDQTIRFWKFKQARKKQADPDIQDRIMTIR